MDSLDVREQFARCCMAMSLRRSYRRLSGGGCSRPHLQLATPRGRALAALARRSLERTLARRIKARHAGKGISSEFIQMPATLSCVDLISRRDRARRPQRRRDIDRTKQTTEAPVNGCDSINGLVKSAAELGTSGATMAMSMSAGGSTNSNQNPTRPGPTHSFPKRSSTDGRTTVR